MKRYPAYKDSGVEWLGTVPEGWSVGPIKTMFSIFGGATPKTDTDAYWDGELPWVTPADLSSLAGRYVDTSIRQITPFGLNSCGTSLVDAGAIIISTRAPIGSLAISAVAMCTNQGCKTLSPKADASSDYFYYVFLTARDDLNILGRGSTFVELSGDQLSSFQVPLPPLPEQRTIADFLDRETAKIDALVEEQRRLIALLAEKRQAVISHAVTKGLNPDAPLKPSGIDWLGDIPEGWDRVTLGRICLSVSDGPHFSPNYVDDGIPFLSARNVAVDRWQLDDVKYISEQDFLEFSKRVVPKWGDILYTKGGTTGVARVVDLEFDFQIWVHIAVLKLIPSVDPFFIAHTLNSAGCYEQSQLYTRGATNQDLGSGCIDFRDAA